MDNIEKENVAEYEERQKLLSELEYEFVKQFISVRKNHHLSQQAMANKCNVIRETVARIETCMTSPQINTLIKLLQPIGYTIKIVPIENEGVEK